MTDRLVAVSRCAKVVKGGRRFVNTYVVGDGNGTVGIEWEKRMMLPRQSARRSRMPRKRYRSVSLTELYLMR